MFGEWSKPSGAWVTKGEVVAVAETTKSVFDIEAPAAGYLTLLAAPGAEVAIGEVIGVLSPTVVSLDAVHAWLVATATPATETTAEPARSWTKKAELLAERHKVDISQVPAAGDRVTEADVEAYVVARTSSQKTARGAIQADVNDTVDDRYPANRAQRLLIIGGGNGAIQIIDALQGVRHQRAVAVIDDNRAIHGKRIAGVPVLGAIDLSWAVDQHAAGLFDAAVISISTSIPFRERIFDEWKSRGIPFANVIHPSAVVGMNVTWGEGNVVMALCHFGACATVGDNNFLSAYCSIEHHCVLGNHCSFGPSVVTSSRVRFGDRVRCGTGIYIEPGVTIGADSIIASGLAIWQNIPERSLLKAHLGYSIRGLATGTVTVERCLRKRRHT
ncbi:MAG: bifunctional N-acetylglucosamine-1-phosphate uridyltransferase/glucosamine-1-phosphate acetyltransferase [Anaerolineales bacterium]|nr:bifunctional N-acetylglucosamine-1-phosphate uridyltransferase/glucosamine-1-phosphate acetyltransferase [Anaerolineales bacterium]